ncbi:MAG: TRAP transporter small permease [Alphaproteobacteria bacterium]
MKAHYVRAMDRLQRLCVVISGLCLVVITLIIPWGVFTRYVLNSAASWPEPLAVLLMIWFSFMSAAVCYREYLHIGVQVVPAMLKGTARIACLWLIELCMAATTIFMFWYGIQVVKAFWYQSIADFPIVSTGVSYLPVPIGGAIITLFVIERLWTGKLYHEQSADEMSHVATE